MMIFCLLMSACEESDFFSTGCTAFMQLVGTIKAAFESWDPNLDFFDTSFTDRLIELFMLLLLPLLQLTKLLLVLTLPPVPFFLLDLVYLLGLKIVLKCYYIAYVPESTSFFSHLILCFYIFLFNWRWCWLC